MVIRALMLVAGTVLWFGGFLVVFSKNSPVKGAMAVVLFSILFAATVVLPYLGLLLLRGKQHDFLFKSLLVPAFVVSLLPGIAFLGLAGLVMFGPTFK